jgi:hypothetical protein
MGSVGFHLVGLPDVEVHFSPPPIPSS